MSHTLRKAVSIFLLVAMFSLTCANNAAQSHTVNLDELLSETQKGSPHVDKVVLAWWIPQEYWESSLSQTPTLSVAVVSEFIRMLKPYSVFMVVDGRIDVNGAIVYKTEREIRNSIQLVDSQGNRYAAIPEANLNADTKGFLSMMKPLLENAMGQLGKNFHFVLFPATNKERLPIMEAKKEGRFSLNLGGDNLRWRLPLGSLLPQKVCPIDGEELSGAWKYCPWHGALLKTKP